jgi:protein-tyrosine-phosphatase
MNILFVCRYNRFRSRIALAYFNKINKNKNIKAKSVGLIKGQPLNPFTIRIAKGFGFDIKGKIQGLTSKLMAWQDVTVVVADDVPPQVFDKNKKYGKKVIVWKIKDVAGTNIFGIKKIIKSIMTRVDMLNKQLEKPLRIGFARR